MTTIIGIQGDGFAVLCSDSRISSVDDEGYVSRVQTLATGISKIAQIGNILVGVAGDLRAINLINYSFQPPQPAPGLKGKKLDEFVTNKFTPALRECFDANGYSPPPREASQHLAEHGSEMLVVVNRTIYQIENDYAWSIDSSGMYSIGSGLQYALGSLSALMPPRPFSLAVAKKHVLKAMSITAKYDPHTGPPYAIYHQDENTIQSRKKST
jgi:ATP-dependent protease HslVU (ClpYQ) peptidase subunit